MLLRAHIESVMNDEQEQDNSCVNDVEEFFDSDLFKVLAEPVRCDLLKFLAIRGACDISTISANFKQDRSVISRHLNQMYTTGLLTMKKESRYKIYELNAFELLGKFETITEKLRLMLNTHCEA